jgi:hypothetical protein
VLLLAAVGGVLALALTRGTRATVEPRALWGAWIDGSVYGNEGDAPWSSSTIADFERDAGKRVSIIHFGQPWQWCKNGNCTFAPFMTTAMKLTRAHGSIPMVTWGSWARENGIDQPAFRLRAIADGRYDGYIRRWALAAKRWGHPFFLRLDHEMNLTCCWPWAERMNGNTPGSYVAMWRHVHDVFTRVGATNVTWVWCPNRSYQGSAEPLSALYPGDRYVDWTCLDGYNWGSKGGVDSSGWLTFRQLFSSTYRLITTKIAPTKPMMIGETSSAETGGSKSRWIDDAFRQLATSYPKIRAVVWFNDDEGGQDWPIESSASSEKSFRAAISSDRYAGNAYRNLKGGVIRPPGPGPRQ